MRIICGINYNILIHHLYYSGVYQYEEKWDIYKEINILGVGTKLPQKTENIGASFSVNIGNFLNI